MRYRTVRGSGSDPVHTPERVTGEQDSTMTVDHPPTSTAPPAQRFRWVVFGSPSP
jgi:hypothetical protein